jgi:tetratricopeptide (TPR) repeat protein
VRRQKTLLLLDGLEPLQSGQDYERGRVKDPALAALLAELAGHNPGLVAITSRERVADLAAFPETTREADLEQISAAAGRALLRVGGVTGSDAELEETARAFGCQALALNLLAAYLHELPGHPAAGAARIPDLPDVPEAAGKQPRRVMAAWAARFGESLELELLSLLGLFDRPAEAGAIRALRAEPEIPGLTEHLVELPEADWGRLLGRLRRAGLLAAESAHRPGDLDAHPLVREHFSARLGAEAPEAWREAHGRLFDYYRAQAPETPDSLEGMAPLYAAVAHGCQANRHQEARDEVFWRRIRRGADAFSLMKLGAFGADLAALSGFFDPPWRRVAPGLREISQAFVLGEAGFCLRALGRLREAMEPMRAALEARVALEDWKNAAVNAGNLSELGVSLGDLGEALEAARQSVELADRSGDAFERMCDRTVMANALLQAGRTDEAESLFWEAEAMQKEDQPGYPLLYSLRGYQYCDLLLDRGAYAEVLRRAGQTLEWMANLPNAPVLTVALEDLSLGRAYMMQAQAEGTDDLSLAEKHLERAVDGLRAAGQQQELPRGLLARAALRRARGQLERARADLEEAMRVAARGGMRLWEADAGLEGARLALAGGDPDAAREHLDQAREIIRDTGYYRRDGEVAELTAQIEAA